MAFRFQSWRSCTIRLAARSKTAFYAAHILDVTGDVLSRKGLLRPEATPTASNIVPLAKGR